MTGHEYGVMMRTEQLPVSCRVVFPMDEIDQNPKLAHNKLNEIKKNTKEDFVVFCLRCSDHPAFGADGKRPLSWWIEKLAKHGFEYHETYSKQLCEGTDWFGIGVYRVGK
jgi:hypothetical protein